MLNEPGMVHVHMRMRRELKSGETVEVILVVEPFRFAAGDGARGLSHWYPNLVSSLREIFLSSSLFSC